jgi:hypothetical protein
MARLTGPLAAAIVGLTAVSVSAQTRPASKPLLPPILQGQQARLMLGSIQVSSVTSAAARSRARWFGVGRHDRDGHDRRARPLPDPAAAVG